MEVERVELGRAGDFLALEVGGDLDGDGAGGGGEGVGCGGAEGVEDLVRGQGPVNGFADGGEHGALARQVVDGAGVTAEEAGGGLAGDVEHGAAGEPGFDQAGDGVGGAWAGAGDEHAEGSGNAGVAVGHVAAAHLATGGDEADGVAAADGVEDGDVVDGDDAEGGGHPGGGQELRDEVADGVGHLLALPGGGAAFGEGGGAFAGVA